MNADKHVALNFTARCNIATACLPRDDYRAKLEALHAEMLAALETPAPMLQDCDRKLSAWLASTPHARQHAIEAAAAIAQADHAALIDAPCRCGAGRLLDCIAEPCEKVQARAAAIRN